jgi:hypothetical protein
MKILFAVALLCAATLLAAPKPKTQTQPDPKRIVEIQKALADHGYPSGNSWKETREICRHIADNHGWQNMWAPDARVLYILGLAPSLKLGDADLKPNSLDADERKWVEDHGGEAARTAQ